MQRIRFASVVALVCASGCSVGTQSDPVYPMGQPGVEPAAPAGTWSGPPGGAIDPGYGYAGPGEADGSYEGSYPPGSDDPSAYAEPSADPADPNYALGEVTDTEIEATLEAYGEWIEDPDYGYVWLPSTTVVGSDFTPYDSSGEWMYTDYGWSFASDFDWGWLPFHYGQWTLYDDLSWGWVPDHTWAPNWCEWRHGGGSTATVGWRPQAPTVRDHRPGNHPPWHPSSTGPANGHAGDRARGHGGHRDPDATWTFAAQNEFGLRDRPTAFAIGDGLRSTTPVVRPPAGPLRGRAAELMGNRLKTSAWTQAHPRQARPSVDGRAGFNGRTRGWGGAGELGQSTAGGRPWMRPPSPWDSRGGRGGISTTPPASGGSRWNPPATYGGRGYRAPTYRQPAVSGGSRWNPPASGSSYGGSRYNPPPSSGGSRYNPPSRGSWGGSRYNPPASSGGFYGGSRYNPPASTGGSYGGSRYNPPSRPSWTPPADRAPSRGSWSTGSSGGGYRAPSSSGSSGSFSPSSGGGRSYSPSSSGGGSRSYSPSSSGGSRSSGGSSSGSSGSSGGGSRSSGGGGGGGRHR